MRRGQQPDPANPGSSAATRNFICIEPVTAIINGLNLAHRGQYRDLQSIPPSGVWEERFWVRPSGFEEAGVKTPSNPVP